MPIQRKQRVTVTFRDAMLIYKNFAGVKKQYNNEGDRNFSILLEEGQALQLQQDRNKWGDTWNIKPVKKRDPDEEQLYHLKVAVKFGDYPPDCWLMSSGGKIKLPEEMVGMLDKLQAVKIDLTIAASDWEVNGNTGRKAYLETIYFRMYENELALEYRDVPEIGSVSQNMPLELEAGQRPGDYIDAEVVEDNI